MGGSDEVEQLRALVRLPTVPPSDEAAIDPASPEAFLARTPVDMAIAGASLFAVPNGAFADQR